MGRVIALTFIGIAAWLAVAFDVDDLVMADASNDKVIAIIYTPHVEPGDYATIRLTLRTGTKSRLQSVVASHDGSRLQTGTLERHGSEAFVSVQIPRDARDGTMDMHFHLTFEPPPRTPSHGSTAQIAVPVEVTASSLWGRVLSAAYALLGLLLGSALAAAIVVNLARKPPSLHGADTGEMAGVGIVFAIGVHFVIGLWMCAMHVAAAVGSANTWLFIAALTTWFGGTGAAAWAARRGQQRQRIPQARAARKGAST